MATLLGRLLATERWLVVGHRRHSAWPQPGFVDHRPQPRGPSPIRRGVNAATYELGRDAHEFGGGIISNGGIEEEYRSATEPGWLAQRERLLDTTIEEVERELRRVHRRFLPTEPQRVWLDP